MPQRPIGDLALDALVELLRREGGLHVDVERPGALAFHMSGGAQDERPGDAEVCEEHLSHLRKDLFAVFRVMYRKDHVFERQSGQFRKVLFRY